jgi:hypothetical protein
LHGIPALASRLRQSRSTEAGVTTLCVWCRREGRAAESEDSGAIVGLCDEHISRFNAEVETALHGPDDVAGDVGRLPGAHAWRRHGRRATDTLVGRIADVLVQNARTDLCDACVAAELRATVAEAADAAARLARSPDFLRDHWRCGRCGSRRMVTRARSRLVAARSATPSTAA